MKRFGLDDIERGLIALDRRLDAHLELTIIGGAAVAMLCRDATLATKDVDTWQLGDGEQLRLTRALAGVALEIGPSTVADMPYHFEDPSRGRTGQ